MYYVGFWKRVLAYTLDLIFFYVLIFGIAYYFLGFDQEVSNFYSMFKDAVQNKNGVLDDRIVHDFVYNYIIIPNVAFMVRQTTELFMTCSVLQGTPAKLLLGIKVTNLDGNRITLLQSLMRLIMKGIGGMLLLGWIWVVFRNDKAAWHDMFAKTRVMRRIPKFNRPYMRFDKREHQLRDRLAIPIAYDQKPADKGSWGK